MKPLVCAILALAAAFLPKACSAAAVSHSIFRSDNGGLTWTPSSVGIPSPARIPALARLDHTLLAGTDAGVFRSTNGALQWLPTTSANAQAPAISALVAHRGVAIAGTPEAGLLLSPDHGQTWNRITHAPSIGIRSLVATPDLVLAATESLGVLTSTDAGGTWTRRSAGLPAGAQVFELAVWRGRWFAALYAKGVFAWDPASESWTRAGGVEPLALTATAEALIGGLNPGGLFATRDHGSTWEQGLPSPVESILASELPLPIHAPVWTLAASPHQAWAGAADGLFRSDDHGRTWRRVTEGLPWGRPAVAILPGPQLLLVSIDLPASAP